MNETQLLINIAVKNPSGSLLTVYDKKKRQTGRILFHKKIYFVGSMFTGNTPKIQRTDGERTVIKCLFWLEEGEYCFQYKTSEACYEALTLVKANQCNIIDFYVFD